MAIGAIPRARRLAVSAAAAALFGSTLLPVAGQAAVSYAWQPGPGAVSGTTIYGRITSPAAGDNVQGGKTVTVRGWAFDPSSAIDSVQVWANGGPDTGGIMLGQGTEGATNVEAAEDLGTDAALKSGFAVTLNNDLVSNLLQPNAMSTLTVGVHSKANGWWMKSVVVNVLTPLVIAFPNDPVNVLMFPKNGDTLYYNFFNKSNNTSAYTFFGYALDRNLIANPDANRGNSSSLSGVDRVQGWVDGDKTTGTCLFGCGIGPSYGALIVSGSNASSSNATNASTANAFQQQAYAAGPGNTNYIIPLPGGTYGRQFDLAGWSYSTNSTRFSLGSHELRVYARSSITGNETMTMSTFQVSCGPSNAGCNGPAFGS